MAAPGAESTILEMNVAEMRQLFNEMDPAPFRERDLDPNAETYIVEWAREQPGNSPLELEVRLSQERATPEAATVLQHAVSAYFAERGRSTQRRLRQLLRNGRISLLIGVVFLAMAVLVGGFLARLIGSEDYGEIAQESLLIGGWVAMWRPIEIFLYDWWPIRGEARLFDRLSEMTVRVIDGPPAAT